jgi:hypothetical protein
MSVPPADSFWIDGQRWSTAARLGFGIPQGYFIGPDQGGRQARWGAPPTWTANYLYQTISTGQPPAEQPGDRDRFLADLRYWRVGALVLMPQQVHWEALRKAIARFLGDPQLIGGVWVWDARALT